MAEPNRCALCSHLTTDEPTAAGAYADPNHLCDTCAGSCEACGATLVAVLDGDEDPDWDVTAGTGVRCSAGCLDWQGSSGADDLF